MKKATRKETVTEGICSGCGNNFEKNGDPEEFCSDCLEIIALQTRCAEQENEAQKLLETANRISNADAKYLDIQPHELIDAGFRYEGINGWRIES